MTALRPIALAVLFAACGGAAPQADTPITMIDMEPEVVVAQRPPFPAVAEPLGLVPPPPPLPPFGGRAAFPSDALIEGWHLVNRASIDHPPPDAPASASLADVQRWAERDFSAWLVARRTALAAAETHLNGLAEGPAQERGVAAALVSRLYDDFLYDLTGNATIPSEITGDPELLRIYTDAIHSAAVPLLERAADTIVYCARTLADAPNGWWTAWGDYCQQRGSLLSRAPRQVAVAVIAERIAAWSPPAQPEVAIEPLAPLAAPRPRAIPRALREDVAGLDALVQGRLALDSSADPGPSWATFATYVRGPSRNWPPPMTERLTSAANALVPAASEAPTDDPRREVLSAQTEALVAALTIEDRARRCWAARSFLLGVLAADYADHGAARAREARRNARITSNFEARQRARIESARALADSQLDGDALVQAALPLSLDDHEVEPARTEAMRVALRAFVSQDGEGDPAAVRAAAGEIAAGPAVPIQLAPGPSAARVAQARSHFDSLGQGPDRGARAITPAELDDEAGAFSASQATLDQWRTFAQACR